MFRKENIGISYDSTSSILNNNNYNGRIQIFEEDDPNAKFKMQEKISIKNKATEYRDALNGLQEDSQLSKLYFSEKNISIIQTKLRVGVFNMSNGQFKNNNEKYIFTIFKTLTNRHYKITD
jgi:predicted NAD/FAD-binding protein